MISNFNKTYVDTEEEQEVTTNLLVLYNNPIPGESIEVFKNWLIQLMNKWFTNLLLCTIMLTIAGMDTTRRIREANTI